MTSPPVNHPLGSIGDLFVGADPTSAAHRSLDWSSTPLGPIEDWPSTLRAAVSTVLPSQMPMMVWWGPELVQIYNQAYGELLGDKHPDAVGQSARVCWREVWGELEDLAGRAWRGDPVHAHELPLLMHRRGYDEETFWTFSYSPIRAPGGDVEGILVATTDATDAVVRGRRLRVLGDIGAISSADTHSVDQVFRHIETVLRSHPGKVAFAIARMEAERDGALEVVAAFGTDPVRRDELPGEPKLLLQVRETGTALGEFAPAGGWPVPLTDGGAQVEQALHLPIFDRVAERVPAVLTVGINPHRALDDDYRDFLNLLGRQVSTAVTDAIAFEREHRRATQLAELDSAKNRFLQNVSHELRTPLTLIAGSHRSLADVSELSDQARRDLAVAQRGTMRLTRLVDGLLELARADDGALEPAMVPTDLPRLTNEIVAMFRSAITDSGLELDVDLPEIPSAVLVDPEMWSQIVSNLISNAHKFTHVGSISVSLTVVEGQIRLMVSDTGIGLQPEDAARIFERFHRVPGASSRTAEGAGIGLSLVHDLTAIHDGSVDVESEPGRGTIFTVRIPMRVATAEEEDLSGALRPARALAAEAISWTSSGSQRPASTTSDDPSASTVLVVEDNADLRTHLTELLESDGWRVEAVGDVPSALVVETLPVLVLSDVMLPGVDGIELVRLLRQQTATAEIPIVLLTALAGAESAAEGLSAGATDYLAKPFDPDELRARVRGHAELHLRRTAALRAADSTIEGLEAALQSNRQIGAAIGIAMALHGLTQSEAFQVLSRASQDQNRKLREVADDVVFTGVVPL